MQIQSPPPSSPPAALASTAVHERPASAQRDDGHAAAPRVPAPQRAPATPRVPAPGRVSARPAVLIAGVGPVYGHGLCSVLDGSGVPSRFVRDLDQVDVEAGVEAPCVVVALQARSAEVLEVLGRRPRRSVRLALLLPDHEPASYLAALRAGAMGLVPATAPLPDVVAVLTAVVDGVTVLPPGVVRDLCRPLATGSGYDMPLRERQWLRQIADGVTVAELAHRSAYSEREMYRQLGAVYRRLGASNRTGALLAAQRSGLLAS